MKAALFIFCVFALFSCASSGIQKVKNFPAKEAGCLIDFYTEEKEVAKKYVLFCLIDSKTGSTLFDKKTTASAIDLSKRKACECGADAVVLVSSDRKGTSFWSWGDAYVVVKAVKYR
ncbi:hypothetical protein [Persicitalea jodogahamensis]|uniref:Lipoprotein n=1 Tax=Persicitalea jodogahamensis TaxID=402147 RepID=A0A8J3GB50_9BACT|nr:hypothetical protein [Persicitalea jodogahamensis]GHB79594.1 hypothetical protein GCM10007390_37070 [Persicitalea jodogahamensis]